MTNSDYIMEQLLGNKLQSKNKPQNRWDDMLIAYYSIANHNNRIYQPQYESRYFDARTASELKERNDYIREQFSRLKNEKRNDNNMRMPEISNYTYNDKIGLTTIEWCDGTKTIVRAENPDKADQFTGFMTAYAKKAAGNNNSINDLFDKWAIEKPKKEAEIRAKKDRIIAENKAKEERARKKRENYLIRREALRIKREYEAKKLAKEKYGIPMDEN